MPTDETEEDPEALALAHYQEAMQSVRDLLDHAHGSRTFAVYEPSRPYARQYG